MLCLAIVYDVLGWLLVGWLFIAGPQNVKVAARILLPPSERLEGFQLTLFPGVDTTPKCVLVSVGYRDQCGNSMYTCFYQILEVRNELLQ